ncbi:MAG: helix-turn-helix transcriptional regulator [Marinicaulis sp.]|nr:helix-turn-helix transcriptional regulator [Marinicaulis sp.]
MSQLAKNLKKRAQELGLSDTEIAHSANLPTRRYGHYTTGYREPNLDTLLVICEVLDISPNQLLEWNKDDRPHRTASSSAQSKLNSLARSMTNDQLDMLLEIGSTLSKKKRKP